VAVTVIDKFQIVDIAKDQGTKLVWLSLHESDDFGFITIAVNDFLNFTFRHFSPLVHIKNTFKFYAY
jgi:hypothetical protein